MEMYTLLQVYPSLASYPGCKGGGKAAWYQLHVYALSTPTKPGALNMIEYFLYFSDTEELSWTFQRWCRWEAALFRLC